MTNQTMTEAGPATGDHRMDGKPRDTKSGALSPAIVLLFAVACGLSVANIYSAQPLLDTMAHLLDPGQATGSRLCVVAILNQIL